MVSDAVEERSWGPLLTFGPVDVVRVQVGFGGGPEGRACQQFLFDCPIPEAYSNRVPVIGERRVLAALEPVLYVDADAPRPYSLHQHRWHTSGSASPGALEIELLVTTGTWTAAAARAARDAATRAFRELLQAAGPPEPTLTSRDAAIVRARRGVAAAFGLDPKALTLSAEQHNPVENSWALLLTTTAGHEYEVLVAWSTGMPGRWRCGTRGGPRCSTPSVPSERERTMPGRATEFSEPDLQAGCTLAQSPPPGPALLDGPQAI